jgi:hypothetical protein
MTNTPGDGQTPEDPSSGQEPQGHWEQQSQTPQQPPYGQQPYGQVPEYPAQAPVGYAPDHPRSTTVLVLGILGIVACGIIAPFAWSMGRKTLAEIDASQGAIGGRGAANAGYVLGIIGSILLALGLIAMVFVAILTVVATAASTSL